METAKSVWDAWEDILRKGGEPLLAERNQANEQQREGLFCGCNAGAKNLSPLRKKSKFSIKKS